MLDIPPSKSNCIWLHACSVGEVASVIPLIQELHAQGHAMHLTVITRTGFQHAERHVGHITSISYLPWDLPGFMPHFIRKLKPRLLLLTETEFWPGMLKACHQHHVHIIGINTRISDRSFPKYHASRFFWRRWLSNVDLFLPQSDLDAERLIHIGVAAERIQVIGNLKYAISPPNIDCEALRQQVDPSQSRPILLVASTHDDEEARILKMWPQWHRSQPDLLTIIVPRHPERFNQVADLIKAQGIAMTRWSEPTNTQHADILLVDAMGMLQSLYSIADIAIIAGSLAPIGGHNPIEAAICGRGVITGPHVQNFRDIMSDMQKEGAAIVTNHDAELEAIVLNFLRQPEDLRSLHAHAAYFMQKNTRVLEKICHAIRNYSAHP